MLSHQVMFMASISVFIIAIAIICHIYPVGTVVAVTAITDITTIDAITAHTHDDTRCHFSSSQFR